MPVLIDSYGTSGDIDSAAPMNGNTAYGQSFIVGGSNVTLDSCIFYLKLRTGVLTGTVVAKLYASTGTLGSTAKPTGAALATSDTINASTLTSSYVATTFNFSGANRITLSASTVYIITVWYPTGIGDVMDAAAGYDASSPSGAGNYSETGDAGSNWTAFSSIDFIYAIYSASSTNSNLLMFMGPRR